jgi:hypothetical protein
MDDALETSTERVRHHLRRPLAGSRNLLMKTAGRYRPEVVGMVRASTSAAGVRFLASIREGRGLKRSAREAGVDKEVGYRWLRECYLRHRRNGVQGADR